MNFIKINNDNGMTTTVKLSFAGNIHRLTLHGDPEADSDKLFSELTGFVSRLVDGQKALLRYLDEDEDLVLVDNADALQEAIAWSLSMAKSSLKLQVEALSPSKSAEKKSTKTAKPVKEKESVSSAPTSESKQATKTAALDDSTKFFFARQAERKAAREASQSERKEAREARQAEMKAEREKLQGLRSKMVSLKEPFLVARAAFCAVKKAYKDAKKIAEGDSSETSPSASDAVFDLKSLKSKKDAAKEVFAAARQQFKNAQTEFQTARQAFKRAVKTRKKEAKKGRKELKKQRKKEKKAQKDARKKKKKSADAFEELSSDSEPSASSTSDSTSNSDSGSSSSDSDDAKRKHHKYKYRGKGRHHGHHGRHGHGRGGRGRFGFGCDPEVRKARQEQRQQARSELFADMKDFFDDAKVIKALKSALPEALDLFLSGENGQGGLDSAMAAICHVCKTYPVLAEHKFTQRVVETTKGLVALVPPEATSVAGTIAVDMFVGLGDIFTSAEKDSSFDTSSAVLMLLRQCKRRVFHHLRGGHGRGIGHGGMFNPMAIFRFIKRATKRALMGEHASHHRGHGKKGHCRWKKF